MSTKEHFLFQSRQNTLSIRQNSQQTHSPKNVIQKWNETLMAIARNPGKDNRRNCKIQCNLYAEILGRIRKQDNNPPKTPADKCVKH